MLILFSLHVSLVPSLCFPAQLFPAFCPAMQVASLTPTQYFLSQTGTVSTMQERLGPEIGLHLSLVLLKFPFCQLLIVNVFANVTLLVAESNILNILSPTRSQLLVISNEVL